MLDEEQRKTLIIYTIGITHGAYTMEDTNEVIDRVNIRLVQLNEQPLTKAEEEIFEIIDDILYLFQMNNSNRKEFRNIVNKKMK